MMTIPLGGKNAAGRVALVDDADYAMVARYRWHLFEVPARSSGPYARTAQAGNRCIFMHTLIAGWPRVDHQDGDGLNNQRSNLRPATATQNSANRRKQSAPASSRYKGVSWRKDDGVWTAQIYRGRRQTYLGRFTSAEDAARPYDAAARELWGEFAHLNFPLAG
jgi:hypothetical protein